MEKQKLFESLMRAGSRVQEAGFKLIDPTLEYPEEQTIGALLVVRDDIDRILRLLGH